MYTEILSYSRVTRICWMENNLDGHLLSFFLFVLVFRIQPSYYFLESVQKEYEGLESWFFAFITNFTWILSTLTKLLRYLLQLHISDETNQYSWDTMCSYIRRDRQFNFLGQTLPKNGFRVGNSENSRNVKYVEIRISILDIPCVSISNFDFLGPNLPKNGFRFWNSEN